MKLAAGLATKAITDAISSGRPNRPSAVAAACASAKALLSGFISVLVEPVPMALTVMPFGPRSRATPFV